MHEFDLLFAHGSEISRTIFQLSFRTGLFAVDFGGADRRLRRTIKSATILIYHHNIRFYFVEGFEALFRIIIIFHISRIINALGFLSDFVNRRPPLLQLIKLFSFHTIQLHNVSALFHGPYWRHRGFIISNLRGAVKDFGTNSEAGVLLKGVLRPFKRLQSRPIVLTALFVSDLFGGARAHISFLNNIII